MFLSVAMLTSCSQTPAQQTQGMPKADSDYLVPGMTDSAGEEIGLYDDVSTVRLKYAYDWNADDTAYKKIENGASLNGMTVSEAYSDYYIVGKSNFVNFASGYILRSGESIELDGVLVRGDGEWSFFVLRADGDEFFPDPTIFSDARLDVLKNNLTKTVDGETLSVQPLELRLNVSEAEDKFSALDAGKSLFKAKIAVNGISVYSFSQMSAQDSALNTAANADADIVSVG